MNLDRQLIKELHGTGWPGGFVAAEVWREKEGKPIVSQLAAAVLKNYAKREQKAVKKRVKARHP